MVILEDMRKIILPKLKPWQRDGFDYLSKQKNSGRTLIVKAKRQVGKSWLANSLLLDYASLNTVSAVIEPTIAQSRRMFKQIVKAVGRLGIIESANASTLEITFTNGSEILFKSAQQGDALRGFTVTGILIIDEMAFIEDETIDILMPLVDANNACILMISTPLFSSGRFYEEYISDGFNKLVLDWNKYDTSEFLSATKLEEYRKRLSPNKFKSEYLGQFITENGLLFNNLEGCIGKPSSDDLIYIGIDFATGSGSDYTSIVGINKDGEQVFIERIKDTPPTKQVEWLANIINKYKVAKILAEKNSIGAVYIDMLKRKIKVPITNWVTSNKSKKDLVTTLQMALENNQITILEDEKMLDELRKYQAEVNLKTNTVSYNASVGNDDDVIALMLAYYAYKGTLGNYNISIL